MACRFRWREWRPQPSLPDWWTALDTVGTEASILSKLTEEMA